MMRIFCSVHFTNCEQRWAPFYHSVSGARDGLKSTLNPKKGSLKQSFLIVQLYSGPFLFIFDCTIIILRGYRAVI